MMEIDKKDSKFPEDHCAASIAHPRTAGQPHSAASLSRSLLLLVATISLITTIHCRVAQSTPLSGPVVWLGRWLYLEGALIRLALG